MFEGKVTLEDGVKIGPNCVIKSAHLGTGTRVEAFSLVEEATTASECVVGPYARLRPGAELAEQAKVGNFCEIK